MIAIARRELVAVLRSPRALVVQLAFLIVPGLLVLLRWPNDAHADVGGNAAGQVIRVFGYGLMAGLREAGDGEQDLILAPPPGARRVDVNRSHAGRGGRSCS